MSNLLLFYEKPVALDRQVHRHMRVHVRGADHAVAARTNSVFLGASEMGAASAHYPIVFVGDPESKSMAAAALLGLRDAENLFVGSGGAWKERAYVPAFVRRYPFVLAEGEGEGEQLTVCIDSAFAGLDPADPQEGQRLFDDEGQDTPYLKAIIEFMRQYREDMLLASRLVVQLAEAGLLVARVIDVSLANGQQQKLDGFMMVDPEKLAQLDAQAVAALHASGALGLAYVHLASVNHLAELAHLLSLRMAAPDGGGSQAAPAPQEAAAEAA